MQSDNLRPTDATLDSQDAQVTTILEHNQQVVGGRSRASASEQTIECITTACAMYLERMASLAQLSADNQQHRHQINTQLQKLEARVAALVTGAQERTIHATAQLAAAKQAQLQEARRLTALVAKRREELVAEGEDGAIVDLLAHWAIVASAKEEKAAAATILDALASAGTQKKKLAATMAKEQATLSFYQSVTCLSSLVVERTSSCSRPIRRRKTA